MDELFIVENWCEFPHCTCVVPDYAYSKENRIQFCETVKQLTEFNELCIINTENRHDR